MFFMAFKGGGGAYAIVGIFAIFFGLILIVAYTVPGVGVVAVWFAAIGALHRRLLPDLSRPPTAEGVRSLRGCLPREGDDDPAQQDSLAGR